MNTTTAPSPQQILTGAIDILSERGWCQGTLIRYTGAVCMVGAMRIAAARRIGMDDDDIFAAAAGRKDVWPEEMRDELKAAFDKSVILAADQIDGAILDKWNDVDGRTVDEVISVLQAAAAETRCRECGGLKGGHGLVHERYPQGGGGVNRMCSRATEAGESK